MVIIKTHGHTKQWGYTWKLCPYSDAYKTLFYDEGFSGPSPAVSVGGSLATTPHADTEGRMVLKSTLDLGWICTDPGCAYYLTNNQFYCES